jgi:hypothetical protein
MDRDGQHDRFHPTFFGTWRTRAIGRVREIADGFHSALGVSVAIGVAKHLDARIPPPSNSSGYRAGTAKL